MMSKTIYEKAEQRRRMIDARRRAQLDAVRLMGAHYAGRACFKQPLDNVDPLLHELSVILEDHAGFIADICKRAGVCRTTVQRWMHEGKDPKLSYFKATLNALGYDLKIVRKRDDDDY